MAQALWDTALGQAQQATQQQWESAQAELAQQRNQLTTDRAELERERQTWPNSTAPWNRCWPCHTQVADLTRRLADADAWRQEKEQSVTVLTNRLEGACGSGRASFNSAWTTPWPPRPRNASSCKTAPPRTNTAC